MFSDIVTRLDQDMAKRLEELGYYRVYVINDVRKPLIRKHGIKQEDSKNINSKNIEYVNYKNLRVYNIPFVREKERALKHKGLVAVSSQEWCFKNKKPMLILLDWSINMHDSLHQRRSALNHVTARLASKNNKVMVFSVKNVREANNKPLILGRAMQDARLVEKYNCPFVIATLSDNAKHLQSIQTLRSFAFMLGFDQHTIKKSKLYWDVIETYL